MTALLFLVRRNIKVFFRDKSVFFPSLITPLILLFLFIAFLGDVYRDSIRSVVEGFPISDSLVESIASGWLVSSLVAVCAVTIAFTANIIAVQDRVTGAADDFRISPVSRPVLALSYFVSTFLVTLLICLVALLAGFLYMGVAGWHASVTDVLFTLLDTVLLSLFGTALSSIVCHFVRSQGGVTAVQATVSAAYGFLCGAYMPIGSYAGWLGTVLKCLPGTYGTGLLHLHLMGGAIDAVTEEGLPAALAEGLKSGFDCTLTFSGTAVPVWVSYLVLAGAALVLTLVYVYLCSRRMRARSVRTADKR